MYYKIRGYGDVPKLSKIFANNPVSFEMQNGTVYKVSNCLFDYIPLDNEDDDSEEILALTVWAEGVPSPFDVYEEDVKRVILDDKPKT